MSLPKVLAIGMVVGLVAMLISLAGVLAQGGEGTVTIRDSDDTNYSDLLSDMAHINFTGLDVLPAGQVYEGWLVNTDAAGAPVRAQSTGRFTVDSDGNADMTYLSSGDAAGENIVTEFTTFLARLVREGRGNRCPTPLIESRRSGPLDTNSTLAPGGRI